MLTVDEEIYRLTPAFVIATVDKFARLAREGEAAALFGYVGRRCARHGYVHPDYTGCNIATAHPANNGHPAATVRPVGRLRPPDLIIQDELHLITGALGTAVGLFEVAVETLARRGSLRRQARAAADRRVHRDGAQRRRSRCAASTGGRSRCSRRRCSTSPTPTSPKRSRSASRTPAAATSGSARRACACPARRSGSSEVLLSAGQLLFDRAGAAADPYMTLVGYFNATRELAGMARYMADDVAEPGRKPPRKDSGFPPRLRRCVRSASTSAS